MDDKHTAVTRRAAVKKIVMPAAYMSAWSTPVVQSLMLPAHAQTSCMCGPDDIPGRWQLEVLGPAASSSEIVFFPDGSADHNYINAWQFSNAEFRMTQGTRWVFIGTCATCYVLSGSYVNIFTVPILGNVIVRKGDWVASRIE